MLSSGERLLTCMFVHSLRRACGCVQDAAEWLVRANVDAAASPADASKWDLRKLVAQVRCAQPLTLDRAWALTAASVWPAVGHLAMPQWLCKRARSGLTSRHSIRIL